MNKSDSYEVLSSKDKYFETKRNQSDIPKAVVNDINDSGYHSLNDPEYHQLYTSNALFSKSAVQTAPMEKIDINKVINRKNLSNVPENKISIVNHVIMEQSPFHHEGIKSCVTTSLDSNANHIQHSPHMCSGAPPDSVSSDKFHFDAADLAEKIEFCLLFGYPTQQIKNAILKLGHKASKNDILAELSSPVSLSAAYTSEKSKENYQGNGEGLPNLKSDDTRNPNLEQSLNSEAYSDHVMKTTSKQIKLDYDDDSQNLRPIVIDGSNIAMSHGNKQCFSSKGIFLAVKYFRSRGHSDITVFVPNYRVDSSKHSVPTKDPEILIELEKQKTVVFTPSRNTNGKRVVCDDDRFILHYAQDVDGVIVSNNNFQDLQREKPEWKQLIERRLLMYSFVSDRFMPPDDPLGRNGPSIDNFLRKRPLSEIQSKQQCPYGRKCNYGKKCKYFHPEHPRPSQESVENKRTRLKNLSLMMTRELIRSHDQQQLVDQLPSQSPQRACGNEVAFKSIPSDVCGPNNQVLFNNATRDFGDDHGQPYRQMSVFDAVPSRQRDSVESLQASSRGNEFRYHRAHTDPCPSSYYSHQFSSTRPCNPGSSANFFAPRGISVGGFPTQHWPVAGCQQPIGQMHPGVAAAPCHPSQLVDRAFFNQPSLASQIPFQSQPFVSLSSGSSMHVGSVNSVNSNNSFPGSYERSKPFYNLLPTSPHSDPNCYPLHASADHVISNRPGISSSHHRGPGGVSMNGSMNMSAEASGNRDRSSVLNVYKHLSSLYPRQKVEAVMNIHPHLKDPAEIIKVMQRL